MTEDPHSIREIHKYGWLRILPQDEKKICVLPKKVWIVFCIHDEKLPYLEVYADKRTAILHKPDVRYLLTDVLHISPTICPLEGEFEFVITLDAPTVRLIRLTAPSWNQMMAWIEGISAKLREMKILSPKENVYTSHLPEIKRPLLPTRDPNSPLPVPPTVPYIPPGVEPVPATSQTEITEHTTSTGVGLTSRLMLTPEQMTRQTVVVDIEGDDEILQHYNGQIGSRTVIEVPPEYLPFDMFDLNAITDVLRRINSNNNNSSNNNNNNNSNANSNSSSVTATSIRNCNDVTANGTNNANNNSSDSVIVSGEHNNNNNNNEVVVTASSSVVVSNNYNNENVTGTREVIVNGTVSEPNNSSNSSNTDFVNNTNPNNAAAANISHITNNSNVISNISNNNNNNSINEPPSHVSSSPSNVNVSITNIVSDEQHHIPSSANSTNASFYEHVFLPSTSQDALPVSNMVSISQLPKMGRGRANQRGKRKNNSNGESSGTSISVSVCADRIRSAGGIPTVQVAVDSDRVRSPPPLVMSHRLQLIPQPISNHRQVDGAELSQTHPTLREQQVMQLRREMTHPAGVKLQLRKKDCLGSIAFIDAFQAVWIAGWKQKEHPILYNALHIGDQLLSVAGKLVYTSADAHKMIRTWPSLYIEFVIRRIPCGRVLALRREFEGQNLGITQEGNTAEIKDVTAQSVAATQGLTSRTPTMDGLSLCTWYLTEINGRPLNLSFKDNEVKDRLNAVGLDISLLVQPSDLIKQIKKQLKNLKNYKEYLLQ